MKYVVERFSRLSYCCVVRVQKMLGFKSEAAFIFCGKYRQIVGHDFMPIAEQHGFIKAW